MREKLSRRGRTPLPTGLAKTERLAFRVTPEFDEYFRTLCADRVKMGEVAMRVLEKARADGTLEGVVREIELERYSALRTLPKDELARRHRLAQAKLRSLESALSQSQPETAGADSESC
ncbi:hypothetical protein [Burkholderia sp. Ac-20365]|uniref:hypothetical protein n=1 Tax=Burkholderia sp. Ac-20365 TaxID=2703897 RepID=UPI00197B0E55|nr:hypothetical protein [Burkholderia sp. Ac-20365]MBN3761371.1 hypothetical protein [Burkholderia sp. Ac-20365]